MGGRGTSGPSLPPVQATLTRRLENAYKDLINNNTLEDYVPLAKLRNLLSDVPRAELDTELFRLLDAQIINIVPITHGSAVTAADKAAGMMIGGKMKHQFKFLD